MEKILRPERFNSTPDSPNGTKEWKHWLQTFTTFITETKVKDEKKLGVLVNFLSYNNYEFINECSTFDEAIDVLKNVFVPKKNVLFARHTLANRKQQIGETIDQYLQALKTLSKECEYNAVDAKTYCEESIRDAFISGLTSTQIRQRLLENNNLTLNRVEEISRSMESAQKHSEAYNKQNIFQNSHCFCTNTPLMPTDTNKNQHNHTNVEESLYSPSTTAAFVSHQKCYFCGASRHRSRSDCPAKDAICRNCSKIGHFQKVCRSKNFKKGKTTSASLTLASVTPPTELSKAVVHGKVNNSDAKFLIDTGSSDSFIDYSFAKKNNLNIFTENRQVSMASTLLTSPVRGHTIVDLHLQNNLYSKTKLLIINNLCTDVLIGHDIMKLHTAVNVDFGGPRPIFSVCNVACARVAPIKLFQYLTNDCHPIATKSRRFSNDDEKFIRSEIQSLLRDGVIEESNSPWRAQVLITKNENHKRRLVIDYSQTINKFTLLNAYPLPKIESLVNNLSQYDLFSTIDLKSAYHQIPIKEDEKPFTAFEADGQLYQFKRIPFGVTNGVAAFQKMIDRIISDEKLKGVYAYLDDVTIAGKSRQDHDENLNAFLKALKKYNLTINLDKCKFAQNKISILGYLISNKTMCPDPERLKPLLNLPLPQDTAALRRILGLLSHYSKWISNFSDKIRNLIHCKQFPIPPTSPAATDFQLLKQEIANSSLATVESEGLLTVETDASSVAIAASLSQNGRPVAFFSRTLSDCEKRHSTVEREAQAVVESLKKWRHFLLGRHFQLITDQQALSFIFDLKHPSRIKNDKIMRWRLELSPYSFDIEYRPGKDNVTADTLSRCYSLSFSDRKLFDLHQSLCHPGITRMNHWVRSKNLPYSLDDIKKMTSLCPICAEVKPRFHKSHSTLIKATFPFERLSIDFKGPLPTSTQNRYLLNIVDEYTRFPFAYPCKDMTSTTVIKCLDNLFSVFGTPCYIHSDRGRSFLSDELTTYLHQKGIATSLASPYNPTGNGQIERFNGIIWKTITLSLKTKGLDQNRWEFVLPEALHSIRSLLCTATNCTPHERLFIHPRRSPNGTSLPAWLLQPGPVFVKRNVRMSKYEPLVDEAELLETNPQYALIRLANGKETTVPLKQLAPRGDINLISHSNNVPDERVNVPSDQMPSPDSHLMPSPNNTFVSNEMPRVSTDTQETTEVERPSRRRKVPENLRDYILNSVGENVVNCLNYPICK